MTHTIVNTSYNRKAHEMSFITKGRSLCNSSKDRVEGTEAEMNALAVELTAMAEKNFIYKGISVVAISEIDAKGGYRKFNKK